MPTYDVEATDTLEITSSDETYIAPFTPHYGTVSRGNSFFQFKLYQKPWFDATNLERQSALVEATGLIDSLNFDGSKTDPDQVLEFPRNDELEIPREIENATYEIALKLLDGVDPDTERDNLSATTRGFGQVRSDYERDFVPVHTSNNIPSARAWNLLQPYLRDVDGLTLRRG